MASGAARRGSAGGGRERRARRGSTGGRAARRGAGVAWALRACGGRKARIWREGARPAASVQRSCAGRGSRRLQGAAKRGRAQAWCGQRFGREGHGGCVCRPDLPSRGCQGGALGESGVVLVVGARGAWAAQSARLRGLWRRGGVASRRWWGRSGLRRPRWRAWCAWRASVAWLRPTAMVVGGLGQCTSIPCRHGARQGAAISCVRWLCSRWPFLDLPASS